MRIITRDIIEQLVDIDSVVAGQENAFVAFSRGKATIPPVGHMNFSEPNGDYHIKYGMIHGSKHWVVKLAGGFYQNPERYGFSSSQGMMIVLSAEHGKPLYLLQDEGYLTDLRTAIAGYLCAKHIAGSIQNIGVIGTGVQARMQTQLLHRYYPSAPVYLWGRNAEKVQRLSKELRKQGITVHVCNEIEEVVAACDYIVTTTPATTPLINTFHIKRPLHITAVGSDTHGKQELGTEFTAASDCIIVDSHAQCGEYGELSHVGNPDMLHVAELGSVIGRDKVLPETQPRLSIADLTGVAVQDIAIAESIILSYEAQHGACN
ncbi:MAG: ornithine cyclodeaminase family protein [Sphaerospermopsis sp. SIO1G2]|nr:ornithine cyclodeaminase family protein [Sphaerospermopsis sp. SIO1G2]